MNEPPAPPKIRLNDDGSLDEIVAHGAVVHLEQMSGTQWWLGVQVGGKSVGVWLNSTRKITADYEVSDV